jgi:hypothetical protein
MALSWYTVQRAAYNNSANDEFWIKGDGGKTCVDKNRGGPAWNFSNPRAADFFVDEVIGELTRERVIPHHKTFSTTIQSSYSPTKG